MKSRINTLISLLFLLVFCVGCGKKPIYQEFVSFPNQKWERIEQGKEITFKKFPINNVNDAYNIEASFRHTKQINVDEISFILSIISPSGIKKESIHTIKLKDRTNEKFIGTDLGEIVDIKEPIKEYTFFAEKGDYEIKISNYTQKYEITGIENIGILIKKSDLDYEIK